MTEDDDKLIQTGDIAITNNYVMTQIDTYQKAQKNLNTIALFRDKVNNAGTVVKKKARADSRTNAIMQVLLEERDKYEEVDRLCLKFSAVTESMLDAKLELLSNEEDPTAKLDFADDRVVMNMISNLQKIYAVRKCHLDGMSKILQLQMVELGKHSSAMGKLMVEVKKIEQAQLNHSENMELKWVTIEKATGKSREDLLAELAATYAEVEDED